MDKVSTWILCLKWTYRPKFICILLLYYYSGGDFTFQRLDVSSTLGPKVRDSYTILRRNINPQGPARNPLQLRPTRRLLEPPFKTLTWARRRPRAATAHARKQGDAASRDAARHGLSSIDLDSGSSELDVRAARAAIGTWLPSVAP